MSSVASPNSVAAGSMGGVRIGRPPQWTESRSRKLARLYMYTTLPLEKIIKALFPEDNVKKNSAQKTMHKMLGNDPRHLRPETREEMNTRYNWLHKSHSQRRRRSDDPSDRSTTQQDATMGMKEELVSPVLQDVKHFDEWDSLGSTNAESLERGGDLSWRFQMDPASARSTMSPDGSMSGLPRDGLGLSIFPQFTPPMRNDTACTDMSTASVRSLKNRLSLKSTFYAKQVAVLMKKLTIGSTENLAMGTPHPDRGPSSLQREYVLESHPALTGMVPQVGLAVPGDFILAPKYQSTCRKEKHHGAVCWCEICEDITDSSDFFFLTAKGDLCERGMDIFNGIVDPLCADQFGNTPLHLFAALEGRQGQESTLQLIRTNRVNLSAVNKAGQTFLHVLDPRWFTEIHEMSAPLHHLLEVLNSVCPELVYYRDVYGRTFLHRFCHCASDQQIFNEFCGRFGWVTMPRDAFDSKPLSRAQDGPFSPPRPMNTIPLSPLAEEVTEVEFLTHQHSLLAIVSASYNEPLTEDAEGRNGLHCLAELDMDVGSPNPNQCQSPTSPRGSLKRKHGKEDADGETTVARRLRLLEGLLTTTSVDVNHYDKRGNTVLMAFVANLLEKHDDKNKTIAKILDLLISKVTHIDARNRRGETALLVAARCAHKIALGKLLEHGANVHARDTDGHGIMALIESHIKQSPSDLPIYGRLEAVRAVMAKQLEEKGVQNEPSTLDEWGGFVN